MLQPLLLAVISGLCVGQDHPHVQIEYSPPSLTLRLADDAQIQQVIFHYSVGGGPDNAVRGTHTDSGWEYRTQLKPQQQDRVQAYASIIFKNFQMLTTQKTSADPPAGQAVAIPLSSGRRIRAVLFRDDFNNAFNSKDWSTWKPEVSLFGGRNWEFEVYTPEAKNIFTRGGKLFLKPTFTVDDPKFNENFLKTGVMDMTEIYGVCTNNADYGCSRDGHNGMLPPVMSGKVSSEPAIKFGTVEVRAKIPRGDWIWPAIWMMPKTSVYGGWPRSGEIDIMETRGNSGPLGVGTVSSTLHWGPAWNINKWDLTHGEKTATDWSSDFHTWKIERTNDHIKTYVDDLLILSVDAGDGFWKKGGFSGDNIWASGSKIAPFDQEFYLILNVAVGGTNGYFSDTASWPTKKPWPNSSPHANEDFWTHRSDWLPSWQGDNVALQVEYVEFRN